MSEPYTPANNDATIADFVDFLRQMQIGPADQAEIIDDDKRHRYRLIDDKPRVKTGVYQLKIEPDGFAVGWALSFREGVTHAWHSKSTRKASPEQRAEWKRKQAAAKKQRAAEITALAKKAAAKATRIWSQASTTGTTEYLDRKQCDLNGARIWRDMVVVPMYSSRGGMAGLQFISGDGAKRFITGSAKEGSYFPITTRDEARDTIVICEGFATGAAIRAATEWPVVVAFDAGNLKPVAKAMHRKYPDARIIIGADNDQWTAKQDGSDWNPGIEKANQAAVAIGGAQVIYPIIDPLDPDHRTDWDDVYRTDGREAVRDAFLTPPAPEIDMPDEPPMPEYDIGVEDDSLAAIRPLGHNRGLYSFFPRAAGQIVTLSATSMGRMQSLYMLAPRPFWERHYGGDKISDSQICAYASAHLMQACHDAGIFQRETTRGVGAWIDGGKPIMNCGDVVVGDGISEHPAMFRGEAVYESGPRVVHPAGDCLCNTDAAKVLDLIKRLQWKRGQFAYLLAGWLVIAPVGGALTWRPHIWLTGKSGVGKSSIISEVIKKLLGEIGLYTEGSTEARVRGMVEQSTRPVVIDEAESETARARDEIQKIINFARKCSSGGIVSNANASYRAQSCFCFAAINPAVEQLADTARISILELSRDTRSDRLREWTSLLSDMRETFTAEYARELQSRTMQNLPTLLENVKTFTRVAAIMFGDARAADQLGPMIAGAFSLTSTKRITDEAAREWMQRQDWEWHTQTRETEDCTVLLSYIMTSRVRYDNQGITRESTIGDMVELAADQIRDGQEAAMNGLKSYGIKVVAGRIYISNTAMQLKKLLRDTPYIPWARTLAEINGAKPEPPTYFMPGLTSRAVSIPMAAISGAAPQALPEDEELSFDSGDFA